jgi:nitrate reductase gamma subunit
VLMPASPSSLHLRKLLFHVGLLGLIVKFACLKLICESSASNLVCSLVPWKLNGA